MVFANYEVIILRIEMLMAVFTAISGIVVLETFFKNRLKHLFEDLEYLIYFFLVSGYLMYAVGEISYLVTRQIFAYTDPVGIHDVYWTIGMILIFLSFLALTINMIKTYGGVTKLATMLGAGAILLVIITLIVLTNTGGTEGYFFGSFYPIMDSLIVTVSLSTILYYRQLQTIGKSLVIFCLASFCFLLGDIFFQYSAVSQVYNYISLLTDIFYIAGYGLSGVAFVSLKLRMRKNYSGIEQS